LFVFRDCFAVHLFSNGSFNSWIRYVVDPDIIAEDAVSHGSRLSITSACLAESQPLSQPQHKEECKPKVSTINSNYPHPSSIYISICFLRKTCYFCTSLASSTGVPNH